MENIHGMTGTGQNCGWEMDGTSEKHVCAILPTSSIHGPTDNASTLFRHYWIWCFEYVLREVPKLSSSDTFSTYSEEGRFLLVCKIHTQTIILENVHSCAHRERTVCRSRNFFFFRWCWKHEESDDGRWGGVGYPLFILLDSVIPKLSCYASCYIRPHT